jgi:hypothetical protein
VIIPTIRLLPYYVYYSENIHRRPPALPNFPTSICCSNWVPASTARSLLKLTTVVTVASENHNGKYVDYWIQPISINLYRCFFKICRKYVSEWRNISPNMGMSAVKLEIWKTTLDAQECVAKTNRDLIYPLVNIQKTMENHHFLKMGGKSTISMCHVLCRYVGLPEGSCAGNYPLVNQHSYGKSLFFMGKSTISMVIFNSKLLN